MCGICGFNWEDRGLVKRCVQVLSHRGPDDKGVYTDSHVSLGHARLSIIDLSKKGKQPLSNEDGSIWITYNGEIYNYRELRRVLEKKGHKFFSNTDTEVIVHAYEEWGSDAVRKLRGMFAFCVYDSVRKILLLARDPVGKKPLYYYFDGKRFVFASEIKAVLEFDECERRIDSDGLLSYLAFQYSLGNRTLFKGIKKLLGGNFMVFDLKSKKLKISRYWDVKEEILNRSEGFFIRRLKDLLEESAKLRLISDVPVGAFLSGGIDSSTATAFAKKYIGYDFHTFSMGFETFSELEYAKKVADYLETKHHEIIIKENDVIREFSKIAWHFDEPVGDPAIIANYFLSKEARKYVKVVLAGEAGDELFGGYENYKINLKYYGKIKLPVFTRRLIEGSIDILPLGIKGNPWRNRGFRMLKFLGITDFKKAHLYTTRGLPDFEIKWLLKNKGINFDVYRYAIYPKDIQNHLNILLALDLKNLLPEKFLMKADKATMANGLEERLIFLDKKIVEFSYKIPPEMKIRGNTGKWILRRVGETELKGIREILWRKKQGFGVPIDWWMKNEMRGYILGKLDGGILKELFDKRALEKIIKNVEERKINIYHHAVVVWTLFTLNEWYETFFNNS
ncbi:MAG: asparagine synthase (glutamine-hydrolyzing) [Candidatus Aenigmatarchaeota archaeon]|nr:MAG: asparagine synthase (glutamine-hydrolyzing) [Candidatus Aenigmarchaeota archaeon]